MALQQTIENARARFILLQTQTVHLKCYLLAFSFRRLRLDDGTTMAN